MTTPVQRILARLGHPDLVESLSDGLPGADLTSLLLEVMRSRADAVTPAQALSRYASDRFTAPTAADFHRLRAVEDAAIASLPAGAEMVVLAPLVPFGTHRALGRTDQNRVVSTVRGQEVAADPTNALALEAAARRARLLREDPRSQARLTLAACQRVVRAQHVSGPVHFAHFSLFGLVTAGRDRGGLRFEADALADHLEVHAKCLLACGAERVVVELSDFAGGGYAPVLAAARDRLGQFARVETVEVPERTRARGYYQGAAIRIEAEAGGESFEVSDGGFVDWTRALLGNAKERCLISGMGMDRVAMLRR